jgi:hypothetical protein
MRREHYQPSPAHSQARRVAEWAFTLTLYAAIGALAALGV